MRTFDTAPRGMITPQEFFAAQNAATRGGTEAGVITFGRRTWTATRNFIVSRPRVTLRGAGRSRTTLQARSASNGNTNNVINVVGSRVTVTRMTIRGGTPLQYPTGFLGFGAGIPNNVLPVAGDEDSAILQEPSVGVINGVVVQAGADRFQITNSTIRRVGTGVRFAPLNALDGFLCDDVDFYTLNTMIFAAELRPNSGRTTAQATTPNPARSFRINDARLLRDPDGPTINRAGDLLLPGRGIELDFGNASFGQTRVSPPVDLGGSIIENCDIPRVTSWNIALNRVGNLTLRGNVLGGGGAGASTTFRHALHLEDQCRNIAIRNNAFTQQVRNDNGRRLSLVFFAWLGGDNGFPRLDNNSGNTFTGAAPLVRRGRGVPSTANIGDFGSQPR